MEKRYDLFELPPGGFPRWLDSAANLDEATDKMKSLPAPGIGGEYLVRDFYTGKVVAYTLPGKSSPPAFAHSGDQIEPLPAFA